MIAALSQLLSVLLLSVLLLLVAPANSSFSSVGQNVTRFAAFSILDDDSTQQQQLEAVPGQVWKRNQPVFTMDKPWETDVNNGYSSVLYDPDDSFGLGRFRAFYSASDGGFGAADCPPGECPGGSATLVANSSDGLVWQKPKLGLFGWANSSKNRGVLSNATRPHACCVYCPSGSCPCPYCGAAPSNETNILFESTTAVAIFDDSAHEKNASRRFKVWGNLAQQMIAPSVGDGGSPLSVEVTGPCDTCFTAHRCKPHGKGCDACVAAITSCQTTCKPPFSKTAVTAFCDQGNKPKPKPKPRMPWKAPMVAGAAVSADGQAWTDYRNLQLPTDPRPNRWRFDAQAAMFFDERRQKYVGTNRAFRPCQPAQMPGGEAEACGECPIWWQPHGGCQDPPRPGCSALQCNHTVRSIGTVTSGSADWETTEWGDNTEVLAPVRGLSGCPQTTACDNPTSQYYSQVTWPFYNVYLGIVMVFKAVDPPDVYGQGMVHCELVYTTDPEMTANWTRITPGQDFIPLGTPMGEGKGQWDSHICFASGVPVRMENEIRVYYMGGDGPHYSKPWPDPNHRNSSFGLATLRQDGFIALRAKDGTAGSAKTIALQVSGSGQLVATADTAMTGASVSLSVGAIKCGVLSGANVTDHALAGCGALSVGGSVSLTVALAGEARLYTVGFT